MSFRPAFLLLLLLTAVAFPAPAQLLYEEGTHYFELENPQARHSDGPEVIEFFSYGCPHCYALEPVLQEWLGEKPDSVSFRRMPTGLGRDAFQMMSLAFYLADELGVGKEIHIPLFEEIHDKRNRRIFSLEGLADFFAGFGVSRQAFLDALNSPELKTRFQVGETVAPRYEVMAVPTIVVNGRYRVSRSQYVTSYEQMLDIVDFLIAEGTG